jgi:hypothetical protein
VKERQNGTVIVADVMTDPTVAEPMNRTARSMNVTVVPGVKACMRTVVRTSHFFRKGR